MRPKRNMTNVLKRSMTKDLNKGGSMPNLWIILLIVWAAGTVASYAEIHQQRWHYHKAIERIGLAMLWPVTVIAVCWTFACWIFDREKGPFS